MCAHKWDTRSEYEISEKDGRDVRSLEHVRANRTHIYHAHRAVSLDVSIQQQQHSQMSTREVGG